MLNTLRTRRADEGFTLIELLIVIVILGVLSAVVVISVGGITDRGRRSACNASRTSVITAGEAYYAQVGSRPTDAATLVSGGFLNTAGASISGNTISGGTGGNAWTLTYTPASNTITDCPAS